MVARVMKECALTQPFAEEVADGLIGMFWMVEDAWDRIDTSDFSTGPGGSWIDTRRLVATVIAQSVRGERPIDRTVLLPHPDAAVSP